MMKFLKKGFVLPLIVIIAVALVVFKIKSKPPVEHEALQFPVRTVEVIEVKKLPFRTRAVAFGNVEPAVLLEARAEVAGKISYIHPALRKGGSLAKDTVVLKIEPTTFEFTRDQSEAVLAASESALQQLAIEEESTGKSLKISKQNLSVGLKELARLEGVLKKGLISRSTVDAEQQKVLQLRQSVEDLQGKLASYESRKASTQAQINQSRSQLAQSQDTLARTEIRMPFDARIGEVSVEKDEFTAVGNILFEALGIGAVEINAHIPTQQFRPLMMSADKQTVNLQSPGALQAAITGMKLQATVSLVGFDGNDATWEGKLLRIGESIDPTRDTINLVVAVNDPYGSIIPGKRPPLLKGMYTQVEFLTTAQDHLVIPRRAIHQGRVYVAMPDNKLEIREVNIIHKQGSLIVIDSGISEGEKIIITDVIPVIQGLPLKPIHALAAEEQLAQSALGHDGAE